MSPRGWVPETYDARDRPYRSRSDGAIKRKVNLLEEYPQYLDNVYDQGTTQSCVANATSAACRFVARRLNHEAATNTPHLMDDPSRLFVYYNARILEEFDKLQRNGKEIDKTAPPAVGDGGSNNRFAFKGINVYGIPQETSWPFASAQINATPGADVYEQAYHTHALEYCRLDPDHPDAVEKQLQPQEKEAVGIVTLIQLKQCLSEGYPVVFGFWWYGEHSRFKEDTSKHEWILPALPVDMQHKGPSANNGGHTVLCIGYDDDRGQVLIQNSAGPDWKEQPRFWMDYSWVKDWEASDDFWMIRSVEAR